MVSGSPNSQPENSFFQHRSFNKSYYGLNLEWSLHKPCVLPLTPDDTIIIMTPDGNTHLPYGALQRRLEMDIYSSSRTRIALCPGIRDPFSWTRKMHLPLPRTTNFWFLLFSPKVDQSNLSCCFLICLPAIPSRQESDVGTLSGSRAYLRIPALLISDSLRWRLIKSGNQHLGW